MDIVLLIMESLNACTLITHARILMTLLYTLHDKTSESVIGVSESEPSSPKFFLPLPSSLELPPLTISSSLF